MSGILALLHLGILESGAEAGPGPFPAPELLKRLTAAMDYRAPEGSATWSEGPVGLSHALFRTHTPGEQTEPGVVREPAGGLAVVADARLDGREALVRELVAAGVGDGGGASVDALSPAPHLLLAAYRAWGPACPEHLLGDYAFVIWDAPRRTLFAARDPFGVKPLFVAEVPAGNGDAGWVVLSNTLPAVLEHPGVSWNPDELAMGDFLLFGAVHDEVLTPFADIRQVPRGTTVAFGPRGRRTRSLWSLPEPGEIPYRRSREVVEHFETLLHQAVADRLPAPGRPAVIELSGGLDSGSIASAAVEVRGGAEELSAFSVGYERLFRDPEVPLCRLTASALGIGHTLLFADDWVEPLPGLAKAPPPWASGSNRSPPPLMPGFDGVDIYAPPAARLARVALAGWDGDTLLYGNAGAHLLGVLRRGDVVRMARDLGALAWEGILHHRPPRTGLRGALRRSLRGKKPDPLEGYPGALLDPAFQERNDLRGRWIEVMGPEPAARGDPRRKARSTLEGPVWSGLFQGYDPGFTREPLETRHPLLDLRLVRFFLNLPVIPWCVEKGILRAYLRSRLPSAIRRRRKEGLQGDPLILRLGELSPGALEAAFRIRADDPVREFAAMTEELGVLVVRSLGPEKVDTDTLYGAMRLHTLHRWLHNLREVVRPPLESGP